MRFSSKKVANSDPSDIKMRERSDCGGVWNSAGRYCIESAAVFVKPPARATRGTASPDRSIPHSTLMARNIPIE